MLLHQMSCHGRIARRFPTTSMRYRGLSYLWGMRRHVDYSIRARSSEATAAQCTLSEWAITHFALLGPMTSLWTRSMERQVRRCSRGSRGVHCGWGHVAEACISAHLMGGRFEESCAVVDHLPFWLAGWVRDCRSLTQVRGDRREWEREIGGGGLRWHLHARTRGRRRSVAGATDTADAVCYYFGECVVCNCTRTILPDRP